MNARFLLCLLAVLATDQVTAQTNSTRGKRNCELFTTIEGSQYVYNSDCCGKANAFDSCPDDQWQQAIETDNLDESAQELNATTILINGPRYITYDYASVIGGGGSDSNAAQTAQDNKVPVDFNFTKLSMEVKSVTGDPVTSIIGNQSYVELLSGRSTNFTYLKGQDVYDIVNPQGDVYRMFAFVPLGAPNLTFSDLPELGAYLDLPDGWKYQVTTLNETTSLLSYGAACVVSDDIGSQYQKVANCVVPPSFGPGQPTAAPSPTTPSPSAASPSPSPAAPPTSAALKVALGSVVAIIFGSLFF